MKTYKNHIEIYWNVTFIFFLSWLKLRKFLLKLAHSMKIFNNVCLNLKRKKKNKINFANFAKNQNGVDFNTWVLVIYLLKKTITMTLFKPPKATFTMLFFCFSINLSIRLQFEHTIKYFHIRFTTKNYA